MGGFDRLGGQAAFETPLLNLNRRHAAALRRDVKPLLCWQCGIEKSNFPPGSHVLL
jgi:hypothetical protein